MDHYDVIVIGGGIVGASTSYFLSQKGYRVLVLSQEDSATRRCMGAVQADMADLITRVEHARGQPVAEELLGFVARGFQELEQFCRPKGFVEAKGDLLFLSTDPYEQQELEKVCQVMEKVYPGTKASLIDSRFGGRYSLRIPKASMILNQTGLLQALLESVTRLVRHVTLVEERSDAIYLETDEGELSAEMVIGGAHLANQGLLGLPEGALVPYADQWQELQSPCEISEIEPGSTLFWKYKHFQLCLLDGCRIRISGARFLRKNAGIGDLEASYSEAVASELTKQAQSTLGVENLQKIHDQEMLGCRPCDELPLIGPIFGRQRSLLATGFMGQGLALGFAAGRSLADIVDQGKAPKLPRILWPERLRSLGEQ
ncbi:FAD-dependent oxidoreductase [Pseudobacteriovorax antillogorgiicola]|uniref:Glycine/D-amino acid oxidase n=1 Tax=Pseudobacteriovorax antillogorgiicola TaxID=1513793 RepID=A0A1Y6B3E1_9BACT|nr:FAD-dependent oxidoreductase [Pseudobacteriovorax antillogorgiicola]TCS59323.1 glycine/D-amino acid oxidase-like deaminating enzyme [Pseudobacteriovorax antillogorgiicola]SME89379.1 Glycine/D-amino acid oxidase [Pseudobacteriovorax antillogorgiicola]